MTRTRYRFCDDYLPHFLTDTVVAWLPVFAYPEFTNIVLDSWRFLQRERQIDILGWVILENPLHCIAVGPQLGKRVAEFKSFTATSIIKQIEAKGFKRLLQELSYFKRSHKVDREHQLWQEGSHPQALERDDVIWQKLEYVHYNPVRRGYVEDPVHWRYSSAKDYAGMPGLIDVCTDWR